MKEVRLLEPDEIEIRVGIVKENGCSLLLYKDARADMKILDETFGIFGWQRTHEMVGNNLYCRLSVYDPDKDQWIDKMDVGTESYSEKEKGQSSDAFKRASVNVGIGRELYSAPFIWVPAGNTKMKEYKGKWMVDDSFRVNQIGYDEKRNIKYLQIINRDGKIMYQYGRLQEIKDQQIEAMSNPYITKRQMTYLRKELLRTNVSEESVLLRYGVRSLEEMDVATYTKAMAALKKTKTAA